MKRTSLILLLFFWTLSVFSQPQPKDQKVDNKDFEPASTAAEGPPDPPPFSQIPIDGGLVFLILSALGLGANRVKNVIRNGKQKE